MKIKHDLEKLTRTAQAFFDGGIKAAKKVGTEPSPDVATVAELIKRGTSTVKYGDKRYKIVSMEIK